MNTADISIIVPVYKAEPHILSFLEALVAWNEGFEPTVELILIDDGGMDNALEKAESFLCTSSLRYTLLRLKENCGQHTALAAGLHHCESEWIITMDDDLQHLPEYIDELWNCARHTGSTLVYGYHPASNHSKWRNLASHIARTITKWFVFDYSRVTSFRLIHRSTALPFQRRLKSSIFIDPLLIQAAEKIEYTPIPHHRKINNASRYSVSRLIGMTIKIWLSHSPLRHHTKIKGWIEPQQHIPMEWVAGSTKMEMVKLNHLHIHMVREWRNSEFVNREMEYRETISFEQQELWFKNLHPLYNHYFLFRYRGEWIGITHINVLNQNEETPLKIGENGGFLKSADLKGSGLSILMAVNTLDFAFHRLNLTALRAKINKHNRIAIELNTGLGYAFRNTVSNDFDEYELTSESYEALAPKLRNLSKHL